MQFERIQLPLVQTFLGSDYALLILGDVRSEYRILIAPVAEAAANQAHWVPVADFDDEVTDVVIDSNTLLLLANKGHPRGRILTASVSAPAVATARELVPEGPLVIQHLQRAMDGLYLDMMDGGISALARLTADGKVTYIPLPFEGTLRALSTHPTEEGALFSFTGWLTPGDIWSVDAQGRVAATGLTPRPPIDVSGYEAQRLYATARDGTRIPYAIIHRKGLKLDGRTPAWISAYGSYGIVAYPPTFAGRTLALIDAGFIVGYANVRGGGEYGRDWHKAGQLMNKPNTWRDLIDVCEDLCAKKYTSRSRLAIGGRSAGGITVGRAMTERPDLFAAVIDGVGWSNPLRYVAEQNGYGEEPEWGAISEEAGYRALKLIDSYQRGEERCGVSGGAADHRRHRSARRPLSRGEDDRAAAGRRPLEETDPAAGGLRCRPRHRLDPRPAGPRGCRYLRVPAVADGCEGVPARLTALGATRAGAPRGPRDASVRALRRGRRGKRCRVRVGLE